jgi:hypothetical protein
MPKNPEAPRDESRFLPIASGILLLQKAHYRLGYRKTVSHETFTLRTLGGYLPNSMPQKQRSGYRHSAGRLSAYRTSQHFFIAASLRMFCFHERLKAYSDRYFTSGNRGSISFHVPFSHT